MAYFLGRDVSLAITTEHALCGISVNENGDVFPDNVQIGEVVGITHVGSGTDEFTLNGVHGLSTGDPFMVTMDADDTIGAGLTPGTRYYAIEGTTTSKLKVATSMANALAGTAEELTDSENITTNITRELSHSDTTGGNDTPHTFIFNRHWPNHDGTGRIDTIKSDSSSGDRRGIIPTAASADRNSLLDITGIDITFGKVDEDVSYFGQRTSGKMELKNDVSISITRKKTDHRFNALFNKARCGVLTYTNANKTALDVDSTSYAGNSGGDYLSPYTAVEINHSNATLPQPQNGNYGYRIHVISKSGSEVLTLCNLCMSGYSTTLSPDGITEETIEFYGYVDPVVDGDATFGYTTLTAVGDL